MSMLSAQVDRLRELATRCDELQVGVVKAVTMPSDMGLILREAADTIWQLRDDLQRTITENAKLREERDHWHVEQVHAFGNWEDSYKRAVELESENAKFREQSERLFDKTLELATENAALRELCDELIDLAKAVKADSRKLAELERHAMNLGIEVSA